VFTFNWLRTALEGQHKRSDVLAPRRPGSGGGQMRGHSGVWLGRVSAAAAAAAAGTTPITPAVHVSMFSRMMDRSINHRRR